MSKSKKTRHYMDGGDQLEAMRGIRKPMPPATKIINPKDAHKQKRFDWRDALETETEDDTWEQG